MAAVAKRVSEWMDGRWSDCETDMASALLCSRRPPRRRRSLPIQGATANPPIRGGNELAGVTKSESNITEKRRTERRRRRELRTL